MKNLSRATVDVLIATTDGETISIVLFRLGKYPSEITELGSSVIFLLLFHYIELIIKKLMLLDKNIFSLNYIITFKFHF